MTQLPTSVGSCSDRRQPVSFLERREAALPAGPPATHEAVAPARRTAHPDSPTRTRPPAPLLRAEGGQRRPRTRPREAAPTQAQPTPRFRVSGSMNHVHRNAHVISTPVSHNQYTTKRLSGPETQGGRTHDARFLPRACQGERDTHRVRNKSALSQSSLLSLSKSRPTDGRPGPLAAHTYTRCPLSSSCARALSLRPAVQPVTPPLLPSAPP